jgi:hypothetical protein
MFDFRSIASWIVYQLILALISWLAYITFLFDNFKLDLNYLDWLGIIVISYCIFPRSDEPNPVSSKFSPVDTLNLIKKGENGSKRAQ